MQNNQNKNAGSKTILAILIGALLISISLYIATSGNNFSDNVEDNSKEEENEIETENDNEEELLLGDEIMSCLAKNDVVVYGSSWCGACAQLVESFGGYEKIDPIYVECTEEEGRCNTEKVTGYVPEIQIKGELYQGPRSISEIAKEVDC